MRARGPYLPERLHAAVVVMEARLAAWQAPAERAQMWAAAAADHVPGPRAEWTLEYDNDLGLVSFEVWQDGRRVFGLDDWVG